MDDAVPVLHRPVVGALVRSAPFDGPQAPLTATGFKAAAQYAMVPPLLPTQFHIHGPAPAIVEAMPIAQRPVVGALLSEAPLDAPQAPLTAAGFKEAEQLALAPPLLPAQLHDHGALPLIDDAVPVLHKLVVGALVMLVPLDVPQLPLTLAGAAGVTGAAEDGVVQISGLLGCRVARKPPVRGLDSVRKGVHCGRRPTLPRSVLSQACRG